MAIAEQEWASIYAAIDKSISRSEIAEGVVISHDPDGQHVFVEGFGSEPMPVAALDYNHSIYKGGIKNSIRSEPSLPAVGQRVLVARSGGSLHRPRVIGVVRENLDWKQPADIDLGGDMTFGDVTAYGLFESIRESEYFAAFKARTVDDVENRFQILANGTIAWGPGNATFDTNLYRVAGGGTLKTDDVFEAASLGIVGTGYIGGQLSVGLDAVTSTGIEIGNSQAVATTTPYIDFHLGAMGAQDYNVRLINGADKQLSLHAPGGGVQFVVNGGVETTDLYADGAIQFGAGTGAFEFSGLFYTTGVHNFPNLSAHSGATHTFTGMPVAVGDIVVLLGMPDPGTRSVIVRVNPIVTTAGQITIWYFNAEAIAIDLVAQTLHFLIFKQS